MLSESEKSELREKILEYRPLFESDRGVGCRLSGLQLYDAYSGGTIYWINLLECINLNLVLGHAYYFTPDSGDLDYALNVGDHGYSQYPPLTKREASAIGEVLDPDLLRQEYIRGTRSF